MPCVVKLMLLDVVFFDVFEMQCVVDRDTPSNFHARDRLTRPIL